VTDNVDNMCWGSAVTYLGTEKEAPCKVCGTVFVLHVMPAGFRPIWPWHYKPEYLVGGEAK
jgi:hypothetical protein